MDAESFKKALEEAKPSIEALMRDGLSWDDAMDITASWEVRDRTHREQNLLPDRTLSELFSRCDVSKIEVGMVRLHKNPEPVRRGWQIGQVEADDLILDINSGEIIVLSIDAVDHIMWRCARNGSSFLSALALTAEYYGKCAINDLHGKEAQKHAFEACTLAAGGPSYSNFYRMLLGVE